MAAPKNTSTPPARRGPLVVAAMFLVVFGLGYALVVLAVPIAAIVVGINLQSQPSPPAGSVMCGNAIMSADQKCLTYSENGSLTATSSYSEKSASGTESGHRNETTGQVLVIVGVVLTLAGVLFIASKFRKLRRR